MQHSARILQPETINRDDHNGIHIITFPDHTDFESPNGVVIRDCIDASLADPECSSILINFSGVDHVDAAGLGILYAAAKQKQDIARPFVIDNIGNRNPRINEFFKRIGMLRTLKIIIEPQAQALFEYKNPRRQ
jgi:anti-anti-sigma factor